MKIGQRCCACIVALACLASSPVHAIPKFWIDPAGGGFGDTGNWDDAEGGLGGDPVPGVADIANFKLNNTYTVTFAAGATNTDLDVFNGDVTFDLSGFTYTLSNGSAVVVGNVAGQTGRLTVRGGSLVADTSGDDILLGTVLGSTGSLTVTTGGKLGTAALRPDLFIGQSGAGTLIVNDNGQVEARNFTAGNLFGSTGTLTIIDPNAVMDLSGTTTIGSGGTGALNVSNGGTITSGGAVTLGTLLGADGTATVSGIGSTWTMAANSTIGSAGTGTLNVSNGGTVTNASAVFDVVLGSGATGIGTVTVTGAGSRWNIAASQAIGSNGRGVMTVSSGGQVVSSGSAFLGSLAGSEGRVTVTGAGSQWTLGGSLIVGELGTGDLTVSAGGEVSMMGSNIGGNASGMGEVTVTGAGSKLTTDLAMTVGFGGIGTLNVTSAGEVYAGIGLFLYDPTGAPIGTLNLDGGSIFVDGDFVNEGVFNFTDGLLQVNGNFWPNAAETSLVINGNDDGDLPTLDLIGGGGSTINVTSLVVGNNRRGQLLLRQGRVLNVGSGFVAIGGLVGGEGTISVQSGAQLLSTGLLFVGGSGIITAGGSGTLDIAGGTVDASILYLYADGTINLSSGTLAVDILVLDGQFNWTGGTLRFDTANNLSSAIVPKLLGLDATLGPGQTLTSAAGQAVTLQTPLIVDGGALNASLLINQSRLEVRSGSIGAVQNNGLLLGDGTITGAVSNNATGKIRVETSKTLFFNGAFAPNAGELNLQGGTLDFAGAITNSATGYIAGRGALYTGGLTNNGAMAFSGGNMDIHGDVTNAAGGRIVTSGAGATTTFFDDVTHNGTEIFTGAGASTVIFGALSGAGPFTGTGTVYSIGDLRPGNSPSTVSFGGSLVLGSSTTLTMELGGTSRGSQYDAILASGTLSLDGTLAVTLINGFNPVAGNSFDILDWASLSGTFDTLTLPALGAGLMWNASQLYSLGALTVALAGDYNLDGTVDAADYIVWRKMLGQTGTALSADGNGSGAIDPGDHDVWRAHFGETIGSGSGASANATVPEPATIAMLVVAAATVLTRRWHTWRVSKLNNA